MNLDIRIDEDACFYFWVQVVADWDHQYLSDFTRNYYAKDMPKKYRPLLDQLAHTIQESNKSRWILSDLYTGNLELDEAKEIAQLAEPLRDQFKPFWDEALPHLEKTQSLLTGDILRKFNAPINQIIDFLDSDYDNGSTHTLYLVQNIPGFRSWGFTIQRNDLRIVMPSRSEKHDQLTNTLSTLAHEYIHGIENESTISRKLFKQSFDRYIVPSQVGDTDTVNWKMMYIEAITYCFSSPFIRGYLSPETFGEPRPTLRDTPKYFNGKTGREGTSTNAQNWVALHMLPDVEDYISHGKKLDQPLADKMGRLFVEFYRNNSINAE